VTPSGVVQQRHSRRRSRYSWCEAPTDRGVGDKADFRRAAVSGPLLAECRAGTAPRDADPGTWLADALIGRSTEGANVNGVIALIVVSAQLGFAGSALASSQPSRRPPTPTERARVAAADGVPARSETT
jgi:hypothetical protein